MARRSVGCLSRDSAWLPGMCRIALGGMTLSLGNGDWQEVNRTE